MVDLNVQSFKILNLLKLPIWQIDFQMINNHQDHQVINKEIVWMLKGNIFPLE